MLLEIPVFGYCDKGSAAETGQMRLSIVLRCGGVGQGTELTGILLQPTFICIKEVIH